MPSSSDEFHRLPVLPLEDTPALPPDHRFGTRVPRGPDGGARCSTCRFYAKQGGQYGLCMNPYYQLEEGERAIPQPADGWCCDVWDD